MRPEAQGSAIHCCRDCSERRMGCHGSCERYLAEKAAHEAERERRKQAAVREWDYRCYRSDIKARAERKKIKPWTRRKNG